MEIKGVFGGLWVCKHLYLIKNMHKNKESGDLILILDSTINQSCELDLIMTDI